MSQNEEYVFSPRKIVVPIDGSENSSRAISTALDIAGKYNSELVVVHALAYPIYSGALEQGEKLISSVVEKAKHAGLQARGEIARSKSSILDGILEITMREKPDLIIAGTRGFSGIKKIALGSVSNGLVARSGSSVLIVR